MDKRGTRAIGSATWIRRITHTALLGLAAATIGFSPTAAPAAAPVQAGPPPISLGAADAFSVLGGSTITNTGPTVINGDVGLHPGTAVVGLPLGTVNGARHVGDAVAQQANTDLKTAYDAAAARPFSLTSPPDIGGRTLAAGVYKTGSIPSLGLTGRLTLDGQGDPGAVFIFQVASTLVTAADSSVRLINGAQACNVFWQVGSSATLATRSAFQGNILALTSISVNDGATVDGRLLARNGAVTLINDSITRSRCAPGTGAAPALQPLDVRLSKPAVIGRDTSIVVEAIDTGAPVSGLSVQFGRGGDALGTSACRLTGPEGNLPRAFRPGVRTRLAVPHRFRKGGRQKLLVRVDSGGCSSSLTSFYQTVTVTPTKPGQRPRPLVVGKPTLVKPPRTLLPPIVPGSPLAGRGAPILPVPPVADARSKHGCKNADKRVGRSGAARRNARRALLCLLNATRRAHGLGSLRGNQKLLRAAERHSHSMVQQHFFAHVEPSGSSMLRRILSAGYLSGTHGFTIGENLGFGMGATSSPRSMMRAWMNSAPHRANILTGGFREIGLGVVPGIPRRGGAGGGTYTTDFGVRR